MIGIVQYEVTVHRVFVGALLPPSFFLHPA